MEAHINIKWLIRRLYVSKIEVQLSSKSQFDQTQNTHNPWVWLASSQAFGLILKNTEYKSTNEKQRKLSKRNLVTDSM